MEQIDELIEPEITEGLTQARFLRIKNSGELDIRLIALMGGTTKAEDHSKIGQFGTGLKYAISYLIRNKNNFRVFIGHEEIVFEGRDEVIGEHSFTTIFMNGVSMNITTRYGYQWKAWEVIRELWCNAKDEGSELFEVVDNEPCGIPGTTEFYLEFTEDIEDVVKNWDKYFLSADPIFENDKIGIYLNPDKYLKIYKNRVLIHINEYYGSMFLYDFKTSNLNELRQYMGYYPREIGEALLASNKEVVSLFLNAFQHNSTRQRIEFGLDYSGVSYDKEYVKDIFSGWLFLHPESDRDNNAQSVKVSERLYYILQECGLPSEKVYSKRGRYYGGSGYGIEDDEKVQYTELVNSELETRIQRILDEYKSQMEFTIAMPKDSDFEVLIENQTALFSSDLANQSDADLKCVILIAILQTREGNIFKAIKRLIKFAMSNKQFIKIFFGKQ